MGILVLLLDRWVVLPFWSTKWCISIFYFDTTAKVVVNLALKFFVVSLAPFS